MPHVDFEFYKHGWRMVGLLLLRRYDAEQLSPLSCPHNKTGITLVITADLAMN